MDNEMVFRIILFSAALAMGVIRIYVQAKIRREGSRLNFREGAVTLLLAGIAAVVAIVFGAEYIFFPGTFAFAYALPFPEILRWIGVVMLAGGIVVLGTAHYHLGLSFSSFVGSKENHRMVQSGPYRRIRHPIYLAYLLTYTGGGLTASNWVLAFLPLACYGIVVCIRMPQEEQILTGLFGQKYLAYMNRTGRLLPRIRKGE